ncbi:Actin cytoskeleton-regulatory complex protein [Mycena venus]|uniref:Actin cytoskeleton-regulatory complex protein n=1 Tax=Mycena venus TaxID=2733690 RepID=A0A8H6Y7I3_9AGAR|nr:Actin cytoskeleton-regulatory complex protein [Mycena venus]
MSSPYAGGAPQFQSQLLDGMSLQQSFQQVQTQKPRISWALGKAEKKSYDSIFRAWDTQGTGFISGQTALEVFPRSGLSKGDLARIWTLSDVHDRGELNLAQFHVAMGLIYRKLSGNEIPDKLPPELEPPSSKQLGESVDLFIALLNRSFTENTKGDSDPGRYPTIYSPTESTCSRAPPRCSTLLPTRTARTAEDEALEREIEDLGYRVKRINEDLDYASRPPCSDERRKLEREVLELLHIRVPEVERKIKAREERKEMQSRSAPTPSSPATANMTPEERKACARAEAKRRIDARMVALGLTPSSTPGVDRPCSTAPMPAALTRMAALGVTPSPTSGAAADGLDSTIEESLAQEKREAGEKVHCESAGGGVRGGKEGTACEREGAEGGEDA